MSRSNFGSGIARNLIQVPNPMFWHGKLFATISIALNKANVAEKVTDNSKE